MSNLFESIGNWLEQVAADETNYHWQNESDDTDWSKAAKDGFDRASNIRAVGRYVGGKETDNWWDTQEFDEED